MRATAGIILLAATAIALAAATGGSKTPLANSPRNLVVVELYQSQGCSSCPPANALLNELTDRSDVLPLSFAVTYWDSLGWKDSFAREEYTRRQWDFARANGRSNVATPQFVIHGKEIFSGSDKPTLEAAIESARRLPAGPSIATRHGMIEIGSGSSSRTSTVWLVRYDPRDRLVSITRGENSGRTLPHRNIVTGLRALGTWSGKAVTFGQPRYIDAQQRSAVLVQEGLGGRIIAAQRLD